MTMINELITGKGFIMVNKTLAKMVGLVPATIYGELLSTFMYWKQREQLTLIDGKEWFFCTIEDLEDKTTIKKDTQAKAIKTLEKAGLLETKRYGLPAKRYFHITNTLNELLFADYISQKPQTDSNNVSEVKNVDEARPNQISQKPQTALLDLRNLDFGFSATNNKHINNKELIKDSLSNELAIDNYQATEDKSSISVINEHEQPSIPEASSEMIHTEEVKKQVEQHLKANERITDPDEAIQLLTEAANELYSQFAIGRWDKEQWFNLIAKFVSETIANERYANISYGKVKGYVYNAVKNMADHHDYKHSEAFKQYKAAVQGTLEIDEETERIEVPNDVEFYNWLKERE